MFPRRVEIHAGWPLAYRATITANEVIRGSSSRDLEYPHKLAIVLFAVTDIVQSRLGSTSVCATHR